MGKKNVQKPLVQAKPEAPSKIPLGLIKKIIVLLALAGCYAGAINHKLYLLDQLPYFSKTDGNCFFWSESAFHFRHFLMVSEGRGIPAVDKDIQYPEGWDTAKYEASLMEHVTGRVHSLFFRGFPPHLFVIYWSFVFASLSIFALFLAGRFIWGSDIAALFLSAFYAFSPASFSRNAGGGASSRRILPFLSCFSVSPFSSTGSKKTDCFPLPPAGSFSLSG